MSSTPRINPRPAIAFLNQHPELASIRVDGSSLAELAQQQPTFVIERTTSEAPARLVPQTQSAAHLLAGKEGVKLGHMLLGAVSSLDSRNGAAQMTGISMSTSPEGFTANRLLREHEEAFDILSLPVNEQKSFVADYLKQGTDAAKHGTGAASIDGRTLGTTSFELGPEMSENFEKMATGKLDPESPDAQWAVQILAHELEHAVTPHDFNRNPLPKLEWLEEGAATVVSGSPNGHARVAKAMGVTPHWSEDFLRDTHPEVTPGMLDLLTLAGIDVRTDTGFQRAQHVLQERPLDEVPAALAAAIGEQHKVGPGRLPELAVRIVDTQGQQDKVADLAKWLAP